MSLRSLLLGCAVILLSGPAVAAPPPPPPTAPPSASPPAVSPPPSPDPAKIVAYREALMSSSGKRMKAAGMIVKGEVPRPQDLPGHARALHDTSVGLVDLFPQGTGPTRLETDAREEIWSQAAKFKAAADTFEVETGRLVEIANSGDFAAYQAQFGVVGKACGACHDAFKAKD